ncbi:hypothetical protein [Streptomyces celluloflavus]|uniref:hypothetical protein n=1 Tax=Streptomyces celluloflavus TaxID=58344 RepID=UPI00345FB4BC|nr:hypothetical protein OG717_29715 [Streptomyces celluloflavus]
MPNRPAPSPEQVAQTTDTLAQVYDYLRAGPPLADALPLLAPLLDETTGVPILLGDVLRGAAHLVAQQATGPLTDETRRIIDGLLEASRDVTDWHILHYDVQRLSAQPVDIVNTSDSR